MRIGLEGASYNVGCVFRGDSDAAVAAPQAKPKHNYYKRKTTDGLPTDVTSGRHLLPIYYTEINKYKLKSKGEEAEIARAVKRGQKSRDALVTANLRFVVTVANQYINQGLPLPDLIDAGNIGLIKAADKFNPDLGVKFICFAVKYIKGFIRYELIQYGRTIRLPENIQEDMYEMNRKSNKFFAEHGRMPTVEELSDIIDDMPEEKIRYTILSKNNVDSLDAPLNTDSPDSGTITDTLIWKDSILDEDQLDRLDLVKRMMLHQ